MDNFIAGEVQATHTMIDTIYMHKGQSIPLVLPDQLRSDMSSGSYQCWYSLRRGTTFATTKPGAAVRDLLTPRANNYYYRLQNGYVGNPLYQGTQSNHFTMDFYLPTDEECKAWFNAEVNNDFFIVACDVSYYNDYKMDYEEGEFTELTLSHRIIYYIHAVNPDDTKNWYNAAWKSGGNGYLETYEINMPFTRIPDKASGSPIYEMVALSKDAQSYADPANPQMPSEINLEVSLGSNNAGIELKTTTLSGTNRAIFFDYPKSNDNGTKSVNDVDDPTSEIIVKKGDKNIARFLLKFQKGTSLMTQSMIEELEEEKHTQGDYDSNDWQSYRERTPNYFEENFELLTYLDFDYSEDIANRFDKGAVKVYPYPLDWESCSYGFYDGSSGDEVTTNNNIPQWGYYGIINSYLECSSGGWGWSGHTKAASPDTTGMSNRSGNASTYHMYIDASDRPGVIARLPFDEVLCSGTELFVSAWVKSAKYSSESTNAAMLFTLMGVTEEGAYEPLYRHQTGQIPATYLSGNSITLPGFNSGSNEWFQVAFSFITNNDIVSRYKKGYVLQIENNSSSTSGGDMYLDDIRIYMAKPQAEVTQMEAVCGDERTRLNFAIDWDRLLSRTGEPDLEDEETATGFPTDKDGYSYSAIGVCFIDKWKYEELTNQDKMYIREEAIDSSAVMIGANDDPTDPTKNNYKYAAMFYRLNYDKNTAYSQPKDNPSDGALAKNNDWFFYYDDRIEDANVRRLIVDFFADIQPYRPYIMMVVSVDPKEGESIESIRKRLSASNFDDLENSCAIKAEVWVTSRSLIKVNGQVLNPETEYCAGQVLNFCVQLRRPTEDGGMVDVEEDVYFDWFFGTQEEYKEIADALKALRSVDTDATSVEEVAVNETFTEDMKILLEGYTTNIKEGINPPLVLHRNNLDISLREPGLDLVVRPIEIKLSSVSGDEKELICWEPQFIHLQTTGESPEVHLGFHDVTYAGEPNVRIGLEQIQGAINPSSLKVNLRGVNPVNDNNTIQVDEDNNYLYLVDSDDPLLDAVLHGDNFDRHSLPVGRIVQFNASKSGGANNAMSLYFDLEGTLTGAEGRDFTFAPREGY